ncbi:MAG: DUF4116 domain-containing protein, partial [Romboutsia sp.]|nr:DUF4116 domain-containing protein [Romboutsia sp.]
KQDGLALRYAKEQTEDMCLEAVKQNGKSLQYVKEQTYELCLEAVKQDGLALQYVKEQTEKICVQAIRKNERALRYVKEYTHNIYLELVKMNPNNIKKIVNKTPEMYFYAYLRKYSFLKDNDIRKGVDEFLKNNYAITNETFYLSSSRSANNKFKLDIETFKEIKYYLLSQSNNKYILNDNMNIEIDMLKQIALSNNELILVDTGNIKDIHRILANRIITLEDLEKGAL